MLNMTCEAAENLFDPQAPIVGKSYKPIVSNTPYIRVPPEGYGL